MRTSVVLSIASMDVANRMPNISMVRVYTHALLNDEVLLKHTPPTGETASIRHRWEADRRVAAPETVGGHAQDHLDLTRGWRDPELVSDGPQERRDYFAVVRVELHTAPLKRVENDAHMPLIKAGN